ncbi:MAG TPA: 4-(cytidine 5'-diphospho)-2-C-methyl-D-erythritol kinase [Armatimonadota bacterium]|jgi:4-diphosphocytidyl-2-C-methyl-D-erythritol kinase
MLTVLCRAKLNLTLDVLRRRPDGFHDLDSVFLNIGLADRLVAALGGHGIRLTCADAPLPTDSRNLVYRAAELYLSEAGSDAGVDLRLEKRIPLAAGLGGGSSDAAGALLALNRLHDDRLEFPSLLGLAASLGSDVPFFLVGGCARAGGRGERLTKVALPEDAPLWFVLVKPDFGVGTAWAYRNLRLKETGDSRSQAMAELLAAGSYERVGELLTNDLEGAVLPEHPSLGELKKRLLQAGARGALMSGSGSTVFGLFESEAVARAAEPRLRGVGVTTYVAGAAATGLEVAHD